MRLPIFLDTDPGIDDAVAIAAAIFAPELDLQLMTTVAVMSRLRKLPVTPATAAFLECGDSARPGSRCAAGTRTA
ncbi:N-terminal part of nonspecific ribonucleoside hydrolase RihC [Escherichia coli]|nr:N-terminal part of nonspecific ribonucleoside hydrolase RihC [Escherichia coli]